MKCLLIIDVQNGFISAKTEHLVPRLKQLLEQFQDAPVFATKFINHGGPFKNYMNNWSRFKTSPEIDVLPLVESRADAIIEKDIYSACSPEILEMFRDKGIDEVYIAGIDTDCCVLKTALDLFEANIRPIVLANYCASNGGEESHAAALTVLVRNIGRAQVYDEAYPRPK